ncbi:hypothetical protein MHSN_00890 [Metamycoplasma hyosynoviae]|uniref:Spermidine/putrescine transport system substrate-binding protein n=2 Tax=Metamycoplasma hyosynoviae TaxID=29559 RepID=A0A4P1QG41_9BACT|nr:hypothetical protein MHSN_00890 [Metamycoplasma hyosynoviae]
MIKKILLSILIVILFSIFLWILIIRIMNPFKVSIYNYESYLSRNVISKIKKHYSYHTFSEIQEFTKAIHTNKAVAGVGSDHQIAQLILEGKLRKIELRKIFDNYKENEDGLNVFEKEKQFRKFVYSHYEDIVQKHIDIYEQKIIGAIKKANPQNIKTTLTKQNKIIRPFLYYKNDDISKEVIGFEADGKIGIDHFYEFLFPYFIQDKVIAYNINQKYRPQIKNISKIDFKNNYTWHNILTTLINNHGYKMINWTNSYLDNAMIGQFYATEQGLKNYINSQGYVEEITEKNYKEIFNYFFDFVQKSTGFSIKEPLHNKLVTDGLQLVNEIIEPIKTKPDIAIMYNGDTLDSYYANDNFEILEDKKQIDYVKPKNNYILMDAWIISNNVSDKDTDKFLKFWKENVITGSTFTESEYIKHYYQSVLENLVDNEPNKKYEYLTKLFKNKNIEAPFDINELDKNFYKEKFDIFKDNFGFLNSVDNFDSVNYTPPFKYMNNFIKKYYFKEDDMSDDEKAIKIFTIENNSTINHQVYQPIGLKLRTEIIDYYYNNTRS